MGHSLPPANYHGNAFVISPDKNWPTWTRESELLHQILGNKVLVGIGLLNVSTFDVAYA